MAVALPAAQAGPGDVNPTSLAFELSAFIAEGALFASVMLGSETLDVLYQTAVEDMMAAWGYINMARAFIEVLEIMNGFGIPDMGEVFIDGAKKFSGEVCDDLQNAAATSWSGSPLGAAFNYNCRNSEQRVRVHKVAEADRAIAGALSKQSYQVEQARQGFAGTRMALIGVSAFVAKCLAEAIFELLPRCKVNDANAIIMIIIYAQVVVYVVKRASLLAAMTALGLIITLLAEAGENKNDITHAFDKYTAVAGEATSVIATSAVPAVRIPAAVESISRGSSGTAGNSIEQGVTFVAVNPASGSRDSQDSQGVLAEAHGQPASTRYPLPALARRSHESELAGKPSRHGKSTSAEGALAADARSAAAGTDLAAVPAPGLPIDVAAPAGAEQSQELTLAERMGFG